MYTVAAKAERAASREMMNGPMLQMLLEERFKLKPESSRPGDTSRVLLREHDNALESHSTDQRLVTNIGMISLEARLDEHID